MKSNARWPAGPSKNKRKRVTRKPKIRWQVLGLADPAERFASLTLEEIRREVATLSSRGFGQGARSRTTPPGPTGADRHAATAGGLKRRRGATESR